MLPVASPSDQAVTNGQVQGKPDCWLLCDADAGRDPCWRGSILACRVPVELKNAVARCCLQMTKYVQVQGCVAFSWICATPSVASLFLSWVPSANTTASASSCLSACSAWHAAFVVCAEAAKPSVKQQMRLLMRYTTELKLEWNGHASEKVIIWLLRSGRHRRP